MITDKKRKVRVTLLFLISAFVLGHLCFQLLPNPFEAWNAKVIDRLFLFRSSFHSLQPHYDDTVVHVDITDSSIAELEAFYLNRSHHAQVIRNLESMGVALQLYDFIFAARSNPEEDRALIASTREAGSVYFGMAFQMVDLVRPANRNDENFESRHPLPASGWQVRVEGDASAFFMGERPLTTFPALASASRGLGYLTLQLDRDSVVRRLPLLIRYKGAFYPSFSFRAVCDYLQVSPDRIFVRPGKHITLRDARRPGRAFSKDIAIPIDRRGNMLINFVGPWERMKHYRFSDILRASEDRDEMEMWAEELGGKIAVVSEVLTGSSDIGPVPTDAFFPLSGVHANVINTILTESFLIEVPKARMLWVELFLLGGVLVLSLRFSSLAFSLGSAILGCAYVGAVSLSFLYGGIILHMLRPLLILALAITSILVYRYITEEKERAFIRATFGRYLSNEVVEELLGSPDGLKMSGEIREVTFLVSDLRGFTALSARLSPKEVIHILNRYLESMVEVIASYRGTVNEIEGDGILAFFGAPITAEDDTERAVACAIAMQNALLAVNEAFRAQNLPELAMGIGINSGEAVVGNIGSEKRAKYSAIGTPINTAYRIESYTVGGQVLISPNIHEKVGSIVKIRGTLEARFKGLERPVTLYDVQGIGGRYSITLPEKETEVLTEMEPPLAIHCFSLSGKVVSEAALPGRITHLGESSARVSVEGKIEDRSNLKIRVAPEEAPGLSELYAKVVAADAVDGEPGRVNARVQFTWYPDDVKAFLEKKRAGNEH